MHGSYGKHGEERDLGGRGKSGNTNLCIVEHIVGAYMRFSEEKIAR